METALAKVLKQNGLDVLPDNAQYTNRFHIQSESSNRLYVVAMNKKTLAWSCSCMGWIRYRKCKHLTELQPLLQQANKKSVKRIG